MIPFNCRVTLVTSQDSLWCYTCFFTQLCVHVYGWLTCVYLCMGGWLVCVYLCISGWLVCVYLCMGGWLVCVYLCMGGWLVCVPVYGWLTCVCVPVYGWLTCVCVPVYGWLTCVCVPVYGWLTCVCTCVWVADLCLSILKTNILAYLAYMSMSLYNDDSWFHTYIEYDLGSVGMCWHNASDICTWNI